MRSQPFIQLVKAARLLITVQVRKKAQVLKISNKAIIQESVHRAQMKISKIAGNTSKTAINTGKIGIDLAIVYSLYIVFLFRSR